MTDAENVATMEKVVAHYADGRVLKGHTFNFSPRRPTFTLTPRGDGAVGPIEIRLEDLKAAFFVKDFDGDCEHSEWKQFVAERLGVKVALRFVDGEVMVGAKLPLGADSGFFLFPADPGSNNEKIFVVNAAVTVVQELPDVPL